MRLSGGVGTCIAIGGICNIADWCCFSEIIVAVGFFEVIETFGDPVDKVVDFVVEINFKFPAFDIFFCCIMNVIGLTLNIIYEFVLMPGEVFLINFTDSCFKLRKSHEVVDDGRNTGVMVTFILVIEKIF